MPYKKKFYKKSRIKKRIIKNSVIKKITDPSEQNSSTHFMDFSPVQRYTVFSRHIIWFMILITITCAAYFTLLIRDFVILTFNWQW